MFKTKNSVRMHDVDITGLLYFPRQFRFVHETLEDFLKSEGLDFKDLFKKEDFLFVIVHCESNYLAPLGIGDKLEIQVHVENISTTSFTLSYHLFKNGGPEVGSAKTVHVCLDTLTRKKIPIPHKLKDILDKHLQ